MPIVFEGLKKANQGFPSTSSVQSNDPPIGFVQYEI